MSASGNIRTTQIRSGDRSGSAGTKLGTVTGALTTDKQLKFDSNGDIVASSTAIGGGGGGGSTFFAETAPPTTGWTWVNQNSVVETSVRSALAYTVPQKNGTGSTVRYRTPPGATWDLIAKFSMNIAQTDFYHHGIIAYDTGAVKAVFCGFATGSSFGVRYGEWTDLANVGATVDQAFGVSVATMDIYLRLVLDATNLIAYWGDGNQWYQLQTGAKNAFLANIDAIGLLFNKNNAIRTLDYPTLISWSV